MSKWRRNPQKTKEVDEPCFSSSEPKSMKVIDNEKKIRNKKKKGVLVPKTTSE